MVYNLAYQDLSPVSYRDQTPFDFLIIVHSLVYGKVSSFEVQF